MHPDWQDFLTARGAHFVDFDGVPCVAEFDGVDAGDGPELVDLSPLGLLRVEGPDAGRFMQGYATADITRLAPDRAAASALCTREGRTLATFRIWGPPEALTMRMHRALITPVRDLLARYIVFSKADLSETEDRVVGIGLMGDGADALVREVCGDEPEPDGVVTAPTDHGEITAIRARGETERFELWMPVEDAPAVWTRLEAGARPVPYSRWLAQRIRAGFVELSPRTAGEYVPQMLNLQAVGSIAFDKGCYLGQEVVARMQYLGKVKKRLFRFSCTEGCPALGAPLTVGGPDGDEVGEVVAAARDEDRCEVLAVVKVDKADEPLFVGERALTAEDLPYEIPEPRKASGG
jgi:folate-binding protein YgfZ